MATKNPVEYAEQVLDVHGPWEAAKGRLAAHEAASLAAAEARKSIRFIKSAIADRKMEITAEAPSLIPNYTEYNTTQKRDAVKLLIAGDDKMSQLESDLEDFTSELDSHTADVRNHEQGLYVYTSRMSELSGLLHFFAAAKEAQTTKLVQQHNSTTAQQGEQ